MVSEYEELLCSVDKADLVKLIIAQQLSSYSSNDNNDLNASESDRGANRGARTGGGRNGADDKHSRFFVNLGQFDNMDPKGLVEFLSTNSGVTQGSFGDITLQRNHSFFDVLKEDAAKISNGFKGVEVGGREIRVNRDEQGSGGGGGGRRNGGGGRSGGKRYGGGGGDRRSGGGDRRSGGNSGGGSRDRDRGSRKRY